jgi:hypothetical protein
MYGNIAPLSIRASLAGLATSSADLTPKKNKKKQKLDAKVKRLERAVTVDSLETVLD